MLAFVLPPLFYLALHRREAESGHGSGLGWFEWGLNVLLIMVGVAATLGSGLLIAINGTGA
jgi:hypothetical protein